MENQEELKFKVLDKKQLSNLIHNTLKLISLHEKYGLTIPSALKGNLGEFLIYRELQKQFSKDYNVDFLGGTHPGFDIRLNNNIKIQVKTQIKHAIEYFKWGNVEYESSPTIRKKTISENKCDIIILIVLTPNDKFTKIDNKKIYIFNQEDFKYFSTKGCWSGNNGDCTVIYVKNINVKDIKNIKQKNYNLFKYYDKPEYRSLFKKSKNNWGKIKRLLK